MGLAGAEGSDDRSVSGHGPERAWRQLARAGRALPLQLRDSMGGGRQGCVELYVHRLFVDDDLKLHACSWLWS